MKYLLDSHTLLWAAFRRDMLSPHALRILTQSKNEIFISAASAWEITTKYRLGKLNFARVLAENFIPQITSVGYRLLPITVEHAVRAGHSPAITRILLTGCWQRRPFMRICRCSATIRSWTFLACAGSGKRYWIEDKEVWFPGISSEERAEAGKKTPPKDLFSSEALVYHKLEGDQ